MKKAFYTTLLATLLVLATVAWIYRGPITQYLNDLGAPILVLEGDKPKPDPERYEVLKSEVERWRKDLAKRYREAPNQKAKDAVLDDASVFLQTALPDLMNCWLGTPWDFHGTSETPGEGKIACGYFVSTVLRDAGFKVDRYKLARQPSQNIIRTFLPRKEMSKRVGKSYAEYSSELRNLEPGIRIVGLDTHVGFIITRPDGFRFVHSSGSKPWAVVDEDEEHAAVLERSNYRVQGNLTANREVLRKWLMGERFTVSGS